MSACEFVSGVWWSWVCRSVIYGKNVCWTWTKITWDVDDNCLALQRWARFLLNRLLTHPKKLRFFVFFFFTRFRKSFLFVLRMFLKEKFIFPSPMLNLQGGFTFTDGRPVCYSTFSYPGLEINLEITFAESQTATHYRNDVMTAFRFCFPWGNIEFQRWLEKEIFATPLALLANKILAMTSQMYLIIVFKSFIYKYYKCCQAEIVLHNMDTVFSFIFLLKLLWFIF